MDDKKPMMKRSGRRYHLELSLTAILLWSIGLLFLLGWIFTLGVLAGRGLLPGSGETLSELKTQIARIQDMLNKRKSSELEEIKKLTKDPDFEFYETLSIQEAPAANGADGSSKQIKPETGNADEPGTAPAKAAYVVQVASFDNEKDGIRLVKQLTRKGYSAYCYKVYVKGKPYYRVRCGTYRTKEEAMTLKERLLEKEGLKGFLIQMK
ncbi:MAG: SPOR domain-containing protein [Deltaproteobacteria bacterium]|nr:SPOR domain-containing protein [Deltaproteobacteria bacterium]